MSDLTGQFVLEMSERHLWPSDFGKQRPQLLQCSYVSLPPTLVEIILESEIIHRDEVNIIKRKISLAYENF